MLENCDFDLIDIDAYGIPSEQIKWAVKKRRPVVLTAIRTMYGRAPFSLCENFGISRNFYKKSLIQISKFTFEMIDGIFYKNGYRKKIGYNFDKKQYFLYVLGNEDNQKIS